MVAHAMLVLPSADHDAVVVDAADPDAAPAAAGAVAAAVAAVPAGALTFAPQSR